MMWSTRWCVFKKDTSILIFSDTLSSKHLLGEVYYAVVAKVDYSYNHSHKSKLIKLIKPDKVPPIAPQFIDYSVNEKAFFKMDFE